MGWSYAEAHARTMLAHHRDGRRTTSLVIVFFTLVTGIDGWLWATNHHPAYAFGAGIAVLVLAAGAILHRHHGRKIRQWQAAANVAEATRRAQRIHAARHNAVDSIDAEHLTAVIMAPFDRKKH